MALEHTSERNLSMNSRPFDRLYRILVETDMSAVRLLLATAAIAVAVFLPVLNPIKTIPTTVWVALFGIQGFLMLWALFNESTSSILTLIDGLFGCVLWSVMTVNFIDVPLDRFAHAQVAWIAEITLTLAGWWHLVRTMLEIKRESK